MAFLFFLSIILIYVILSRNFRSNPPLSLILSPEGRGKTHPLKILALWLAFKYLGLYKHMGMEPKANMGVVFSE
jgi:hypothetical protein